MPAEKKSIVRRLYEEVWNERKFELVDELLSLSHALHDPIVSGSRLGPELYKQRIMDLTAVFPDLSFTIEDTITEGEKVVVCWVISGTQEGGFMGIPPTGRKVTLEGITIHHIRDGKILDSSARWDALDLLRQLGVAFPQSKIKQAATKSQS